jgi:glycerophosphoryl diester phosphodiesterase
MKHLLASLLTFQAITHSVAAVEIIAHRGFSSQAPENTVSSFKLAWEKGTDACELDMYLTTDQKIVIIHDADTERTTGVAKKVAQCSMAELRALDAGSWKGAPWAGEKLPTLEEALATMPVDKHKRFFLEVKVGPEIVPQLTKTLEALRSRAAQLVIISFKEDSAAAAKKAMPWVKNYLLVSGKDKARKPRADITPFIKLAKDAGLDGLDLESTWPWTPEMIKQIRDAGLGVFVWTVDKAEDIARFAKLGVDGITTNDPVTARAVTK